MSILIEKVNHGEHDDVKSTKELKETLKRNTAMFICEEHVTLWITPKSRRDFNGR